MNDLILILMLTLGIFVTVFLWHIILEVRRAKRGTKQLEKYLYDLGKLKKKENGKIDSK